MNLQQLEYIVALDIHRHFVEAAESCFVTQATLSTMIKKLEDELNVKIFDRSKQPVKPTAIGSKIIKQAKAVLSESNKIKQIVQEENNTVSGTLRIGIIPTLSPNLLPLFIDNFLTQYPQVQLQVKELTTHEILAQVKLRQLDAGILAIPTDDNDIKEFSLFTEEFVVYSKQHQFNKKKYLLPADLDPNELWLLEEGHCLRNQVINFCELKLKEKNIHQFDLSAASIETLKKIVDLNKGITILPALSLNDLSEEQLKHIHYFKAPVPARKIGLITDKYFAKVKLLKALKDCILSGIPSSMLSDKNKQIIGIQDKN